MSESVATVFSSFCCDSLAGHVGAVVPLSPYTMPPFGRRLAAVWPPFGRRFSVWVPEEWTVEFLCVCYTLNGSVFLCVLEPRLLRPKGNVIFTQ